MKYLLIITVYFCLITNISTAQITDVPTDIVSGYFDEIREATHPYHALWGKDLYGDLLLVNPETREIFANTPDKNGALTKDGAIYKGILPNEINFANTAIEWNGNRWAMIILFAIPEDRTQRINLLAHELFHRIQPELGFNISEMDNGHLDTKNGRAYLRLELEAYQQVLLAQKSISVAEENVRMSEDHYKAGISILLDAQNLLR